LRLVGLSRPAELAHVHARDSHVNRRVSRRPAELVTQIAGERWLVLEHADQLEVIVRIEHSDCAAREQLPELFRLDVIRDADTDEATALKLREAGRRPARKPVIDVGSGRGGVVAPAVATPLEQAFDNEHLKVAAGCTPTFETQETRGFGNGQRVIPGLLQKRPFLRTRQGVESSPQYLKFVVRQGAYRIQSVRGKPPTGRSCMWRPVERR
jgi:hypothetical protein